MWGLKIKGAERLLETGCFGSRPQDPLTAQGFQAEAKFKTLSQRKADIESWSSLNSSGTCPNCTLESRGTSQKYRDGAKIDGIFKEMSK